MDASVNERDAVYDWRRRRLVTLRRCSSPGPSPPAKRTVGIREMTSVGYRANRKTLFILSMALLMRCDVAVQLVK